MKKQAIVFLRQHRTIPVRRSHRQMFRRIKQNAQRIPCIFTNIFVKYAERICKQGMCQKLCSCGIAFMVSVLLTSCGSTDLAGNPAASAGLTETVIERVQVDTGDAQTEIWMEYPVFPETGEGYRKINDFFHKLAVEFPEVSYAGSVREEIANAGESAKNYFYKRPAQVMLDNGKLVSVVLNYDWYMGGVNDYGMDTYTFSAETGELLSLTEVAAETPDQIRAAVLAALREQDPEGENIQFELVEGYTADDFQFYVFGEGEIVVPFNKYEIAHGAYGGFDIRPKLTLKDEWKGKPQ